MCDEIRRFYLATYNSNYRNNGNENSNIGQELDVFILAYSIPLEFSKLNIQSRVPKFTSAHEAHIGMSKTDFISKYFNDNKLKIEIDTHSATRQVYYII